MTGLQRSFQIHAAVWFATNLMLFVIWLITGAGFPWFLFPALGWGIGLAAHATVAYTHDSSANDELEPGGDGYKTLGR